MNEKEEIIELLKERLTLSITEVSWGSCKEFKISLDIYTEQGKETIGEVQFYVDKIE